MFKKLIFVLASIIATMSFAFAQVDVNKADQAALEGIKGVGPATSKVIIDERKKTPFKDWADFQTRVKGMGDKKSAALSEAGLTVNGEKLAASAPHAAPAEKAKKESKSDAKAEVKKPAQ